MANYGMAFDYQLCINCRACEVACKEENGIELGANAHRLWIQENNTPKKDFWDNSQINTEFLQMQCQQCEDAPCIKACPNKAIYKDKNGIVRLHENKCDLCIDCIKACPYDARYIEDRGMTVDKCNFCTETRLARGETTTACQNTCPTKVRIFGDLDDPNSEISEVLRVRDHYSLKSHLGTNPKLFYLT